MDIRNKRLKGYFVLSVLIIACLIMASLVVFIAPKNNAEAIKSMTDTVDLGDLMLSESKNGKIFDGDVLQKLYSYMTGNSNAAFDDVKNAGTKDSNFFRNISFNPDKKDLVIKVGQFKWNVVYLSHTSDAEDADVIVTLWLTDPSQLPSGYQTAQFSGYSSSTSSNIKFPASMYGTSKLRAVTLNNGVYYATSTGGGTSYTQNSNNPFAQYTMSTVTNSLTDYIVTPGEVQWQRSEKSNSVNACTYNFNNDAIDTVSSGFPNHNYQYTPSTSTVSQSDRTYHYTLWKDDKIWIPSIAEIGTGYTGNTGIWNTNANLRGNSMQWIWTRSAAATTNTGNVITMIASGNAASDNSDLYNLGANASYGVRPAFHLNLSKVAEKATAATPSYKKTTDNKDDNIKYYNDGNDVTFELEKVDSKLIDVVGITATDMYGNAITAPTSTVSGGVLSFNVQKVGKYVVKVKPKDGQCWTDGSTTEKSYTYTLKYKFTPLAWKSSSTNTVTYNGEDQYLELINYDETRINKDDGATVDLLTVNPKPIKVSKDVNGKFTEDENGTLWAIKVKDYIDKTTEADKAKVRAELNSQYSDYLVWDDLTATPKTLDFTVNKKGLTLTAIDTEWKAQVNTDGVTYDLWVDGCIDGHLDEISFVAFYKKGSGAEQSIATAPEFVKEDDEFVKSDDGKYKLRITLPKVSEKGDCTYIIRLATSIKNYSLPSDKFEKAFSVDNKSVDIKEEDIVWQYKNYIDTNNNFIEVDKTKLDANKIFNVTYNGYEFSFKVDTDSETSKLKQYANDVDFTISIEGNSDADKTIKNVKLNGSDVTNYVIKLKVTAKSGVSGLDIKTSEFTLKWQINKAKFDLSGVTWGIDGKGTYTGAIPYDGEFHKVELLNLPKGLKATYSGDFQNKIKVNVDSTTKEVKPYTATVTLQFDKTALADVDKNYILPKKPSSVSEEKNYIYDVKDEEGNAKDFPWSLDWTIKKKTLDLEEEWVGEVYSDKNDMPYFAYKIDSTATEKLIDYEYYAYADYVDGEVVAGKSAIKREDIVVDLDGEPVKYWVVAKLKSAYTNDYEIKAGTQCMEFTVGLIGLLIKIDMDTTFVYDNKAHGGESDWKFPEEEYESGKEYIVAEYYSVTTVDGEDVRTLLGSDAPIDAGKYMVKLSIVKEQEDKYMLSKARITYEIKPVEIEISQGEEEFEYNGTNIGGEFEVTSENYDVSKLVKTYYKGNEVNEANKLANGEVPQDAGEYTVVLSIADGDKNNYVFKEGQKTEFTFTISPAKITAEWNTTGDIPTLKDLNSEEKEIVEYVYADSEGNVIEDISTVEAGNYKVIARIKNEHTGNYVFVDGDGQVLENVNSTEQAFEIEVKEPENPDDPTVPVDPENPDETNQPPTTGFDINKLGEAIKEYWQLIASIISIILMLIFISKTIGYENKRKQNKKTIDKKYSTFYGITLFGLTTMTWTLIACVLMGGALLTFIIMLVAKNKCKKSDEELEDAKDEFERNQKETDGKRHDEQLQMMLMGMLGGNNGQGNGNGGQGFVYQQPGLGADDIRGIVADTMNNMLPNVTQ